MLIELALDEEAAVEQEGIKADAEDEAEAEEKMQKEAVSEVQVHRPGRRQKHLQSREGTVGHQR